MAKFTKTLRRGIPHLLAYLAEDTPHGILDLPSRAPRGAYTGGGHPMYRRLTRDQERDLHALLTYLIQLSHPTETNDDTASD